MNRELRGDTLVARIPVRFERQGGRKRILASDRSDSRLDTSGNLANRTMIG